ncbi:MAG TPA: hypothetical protein VJ692_08560 [Nitrospiraceae bacterium]|nr:hypothetical protein [Nitrospiraceae bacterium]
MKPPSQWGVCACAISVATGLFGGAVSVPAIEVQPCPSQIAASLEHGKAAAIARTPPDRLYAWFGSSRDLEPHGFLMTKLVGLTVMATHFGLRGETPMEQDIGQILDDSTLLISVTVFGDRPNFAVDSYMLLFQGSHMIKPMKVRFDGQAARTRIWPRQPAYQAKIVASFSYADLQPDAATRISVFPAMGGEISFDVNFSEIP